MFHDSNPANATYYKCIVVYEYVSNRQNHRGISMKITFCTHKNTKNPTKSEHIQIHSDAYGEEEVTFQILPLAIFLEFKPILHHIYENGMNLLRINAVEGLIFCIQINFFAVDFRTLK